MYFESPPLPVSLDPDSLCKKKNKKNVGQEVVYKTWPNGQIFFIVHFEFFAFGNAVTIFAKLVVVFRNFAVMDFTKFRYW